VKAAAQPDLQYGTLVIQTNMDNTELWLDGKDVGVLNKATPLRLPGLAPGSHTIKAVHMGYQPDGPREQIVYPGQETTVSVRIRVMSVNGLFHAKQRVESSAPSGYG